ncbi:MULTISPECIES: DUF1643 domain-containing protein [Acinetobacter]|uniref:DUF1643 domain-containing protein n=1 Tax=Acinetobacter haemolyticus TaxID=29430 RepID=A0A372MST3_ACIHA|nr:DUF1643 domain-containing protein [Acinetobacter haemolyticus]NAR79134.1 DUF1643 domain-containing protein [Acinetobacter haemolyticus]NAR90009.1 DUF1643 domain-containing protein [Acinetobacter haemolyticus]NCU23533.1 DUF1643 domain-containing protein [Acinetobacter haemolyticus]QBQ15652.1 DUF1643 domain-containing protein [Acinetobacter haemolyticus]QDJ91687.1 DUF1643 domain-containing protein [Acinetobacter haemolyticus]
MEKGADISECNKYRYSLWRVWDKNKPIFTFIGLNPSTADHLQDDPTITRCINFAQSWGGGGIYMANLFAYRATNPQDMMAQDDPIGAKNDEYLKQLSSQSKYIIACWGNVGIYKQRSSFVKDLLKGQLHYLELNKTGEPKHPLYIHSSTQIKPYIDEI